MGFTLLTREQVLQDIPPAALIYGESGVGKSTLLYTAVEAGYVPLLINSERRSIKERVRQRLLEVGGAIAMVDTFSDLEQELPKLRDRFNCLLWDGITDTAYQELAVRNKGLTPAQALRTYQQQTEAILRVFAVCRSLGWVVLATCLEEWDRPDAALPITAGEEQRQQLLGADPGTKWRYQPLLPGRQLPRFVGGLGFDIVGHLVREGNDRVLHLVQKEGQPRCFTKTCYRNENIRRPTVHLLLEGWKGAPEPRATYEQTLHIIEEDSKHG